MIRRCRKLATAAVLCGLIIHAWAQEADDLTEKSLPLRTALYHDPTLGPPLDRLLELYGEANRTPELVDLYRQHVSQYPEDIGALTVLIRLSIATGNPEAASMARQATERFPDNAFLQYLLFQALQKAHEPGALDALNNALAAESNPGRKKLWLDELLPMAIAAGRPELARKHLQGLAAESRTPGEKLEVARKMLAQKIYAPALEVIEAAQQLNPSAELGVDLDLAAASAEIGLSRDKAAAERLDHVLARLAPDYWRRAEILHRRTALVSSDAERDAMLDAARARLESAPGDENVALEAAQLLAAFEFPREALKILTAAAENGSERVEKNALDLFDRLRDERGREAFLAQRLKTAPDRTDLALMRVRSLHLLGRHSEATKLYRATAKKLDPGARQSEGVELARFLRRSSLPKEAAGVMEEVVALAPERLDLRRELAEMLIAADDKDRARAIFRQELPADAEMEYVIDVAQFLIRQSMFDEARAEVRRRLEREPQNFELGLLDLQIAGHLGEREQGEKRLETLRSLADTTARYRRWLDAAAEFHDKLETTPEFLAAEKARLLAEPGGWAGENTERRLAWAEVAVSNEGKAEVAALFDEALEGELSAETRIELRRRLLALAENDPAKTGEAEKQLEALLQDDPAHAEEYRLRLALLYVKQERADRFMTVLQLSPDGSALAGIDPAKIDQPALLTALESTLQRFGGAQSDMQFRIVQRLIELEPGNRATWERWLTLQAINGEDEGFRTTIRRLLAGIDKMPIPEETRPVLQKHLLASSWRSIHRLLDEAGEENDSHLSQILPQLEEAERLAENSNQWLWVMWTRAYVLNRLGRKDARDAAIAELERVAAQSTPADEKGEPGKTRIVFPDGFAIAMPEARELLTRDPSSTEGAVVEEGQGPRGELAVRWAFDIDSGSSITKILPTESGPVVISDEAGRLYAVDGTTGKFLWSEMAAAPLMPDTNRSGGYQFASRAEPVATGGHVIYPTAQSIECRSANNGELQWRAPLFATMEVYPTLFARGETVLVADGAGGRLYCFDVADGKLRWQRDYETIPQTMPLMASNCGASLSGDRLFLYGAGAWIVSANDGSVQFAYDPSLTVEFPIDLAPPAATPAPMPPGSYSSSRRRIELSYLMERMQGRRGQGAFMPQGASVSLQSPVGAWANLSSNYGAIRSGVLVGDRLFLVDGRAFRLLRLDCPFASKQLYPMGQLIGAAGSRLAFLQPGLLTIARANELNPGNRGEGVTRITLGPPPGANPGIPDPRSTQADAMLSGVFLYASNWEGVSCYQAVTGELLWKTPWPESVNTLSADVAGMSGEELAQQQAAFAYARGRMPNMADSVATLRDGMLITRAGASRAVALEAKGDAGP